MSRIRTLRQLHVERLEFRQLLAADFIDDSHLRIWDRLGELPTPPADARSYLNATHYTAWSIDRAALSASLADVPLEFSQDSLSQASILTLPTPSGNLARFQVFESPIMEPGLAAQFPEIRTYRGQGLDDGAATLRLDVSPYGFRAQVLAPSGAYYIDPYWHQSDRAYISYYKRDLIPRADQAAFESLSDTQKTEAPAAGNKKGQSSTGADSDRARLGASGGKSGDSSTAGRSGTQLRTYRLATAATGEYTQFHGGTVAAAQAAIVTSINRVTGIYEKEVAVRLVLVANNSTLVYTNGATDPYTNTDGSAMLGQNQTNVDNLIGNANYDIGHVFSTGGGGVAGLGVVGVTGQKARGVTGSGAPIGDAFDVDYVAHEMGHQFGGNHTFNGTNGSCGGNRSATSAYEPGSGATIMGYAGICGADDLQSNSDSYFHSRSFDEIVQYTTSGSGNAAAAITNTGNNVPRAYAGRDYTIPSSTPFTLDAIGTDADSGNVLTYQWEQRDLGAAQALSAADNGSSPLFRSWNPSSDTSRTIPRLAELLNNTTPLGERLPTTNRTLNFRAIVRDNFGGGGGVNTDDMRITVVNTGASFAVTSPNTAVSFPANSQQTVTWNVASTSNAPISESQVDIWLSTDGGLTFPILLASATSNDGTETVTLPNVGTTTARVKVAAKNSIFFDISNTNFTITGSTNSAPTISGINNIWIPWNTSTTSIPIVLGDAQTSASQLTLTAFASNPTLVPSSRIIFSGTGANRSVQVRPTLGEFGETRIYVGVTDTSGVTSYESFVLFVEANQSCESFETFDGVTAPTLPTGWTSTSLSGTNSWATSATSSHSGTNNVFIPGIGTIGDTVLRSPVYTAPSGNSELRFQNSFDLESGFDGGVLEISIDGGAFTDFLAAGGSFTSGGYTSTLSSGFSNPIGGRQAWSGNSGGYQQSVASLPPSAQGKPVQFRWRLGTDSSVSAIGWRVDTVQRCGVIVPPILSIDTVGVTKEEGGSGITNFEFTVTRRGKTDIESTMNYSVSGFTNNPANADDFNGTFPSGTVTFPINATTATLSIPVRGDILAEATEGFKVTLSNPSGSALLDETEAIGSIVNDDAVDIVNRRVFYGGSSFQSSGGVDAATDTSKALARANTQNQSLTFQNLINTTQGINGLYLDLAGIIGSNITASDFVFRMSPTGAFSNSANPPSSWAAAPNPTAFVLTPGTATTPVRARIEWANGAIVNRWLQIKVLANSRTSLPTPQVFYIGHLQGETNGLVEGAEFRVRGSDVSPLVAAIDPNVTVPVGNIFDINKDGRIRGSDSAAAVNSVGQLLTRITIPPAGSAEEGEGQSLFSPAIPEIVLPRISSGAGHPLHAISVRLTDEIFSVSLPQDTQQSVALATTQESSPLPFSDASERARESPLLSLDEYFKRLGRARSMDPIATLERRSI